MLFMMQSNSLLSDTYNAIKSTLPLYMHINPHLWNFFLIYIYNLHDQPFTVYSGSRKLKRRGDAYNLKQK